MNASGRVAYLAGQASDYGVLQSSTLPTFPGGSESRSKNVDGLEVINRNAAFTGPKSISVGVDGGEQIHLEAKSIFVNSGERPAKTHLDGLESIL
ncbi:hypothetical protein LTR65_009329 [Meristemomyces frigidus]